MRSTRPSSQAFYDLMAGHLVGRISDEELTRAVPLCGIQRVDLISELEGCRSGRGHFDGQPLVISDATADHILRLFGVDDRAAESGTRAVFRLVAAESPGGSVWSGVDASRNIVHDIGSLLDEGIHPAVLFEGLLRIAGHDLTEDDHVHAMPIPSTVLSCEDALSGCDVLTGWDYSPPYWMWEQIDWPESLAMRVYFHLSLTHHRFVEFGGNDGSPAGWSGLSHGLFGFDVARVEPYARFDHHWRGEIATMWTRIADLVPTMFIAAPPALVDALPRLELSDGKLDGRRLDPPDDLQPLVAFVRCVDSETDRVHIAWQHPRPGSGDLRRSPDRGVRSVPTDRFVTAVAGFLTKFVEQMARRVAEVERGEIDRERCAPLAELRAEQAAAGQRLANALSILERVGHEYG